MKNPAYGFTFLELLIVVVLLGLAIFPLMFSARQAGQLESLQTSSLVFSNALQEAHNSARDSRGQSGWGIAYASETSYQLVYGTQGSFLVSKTVFLERGVSFTDPFPLVWFVKGAGTTVKETINIKNELGRIYDISVNDLGIVETTKQP